MRSPSSILALPLLAMLAGPLTGLAQQNPPVALEELEKWLARPEADRPSEEIVADLSQRLAAFAMTPDLERRLRTAAESARRPADLVRKVIQASKENWVFDRIKVAAGSDDGLRMIQDLVRRRGVSVPHSAELERDLWLAAESEPAIALLWPPLEPAKPRFQDQLWRSPQALENPPVKYNPNTLRGKVQFDLVVDGAAMLVFKHNNVFYNVICGRDLEFPMMEVSAPLPRVALDQISYAVEFPDAKKKPRGAVFACPQDPRCQKADSDTRKDAQEKLCSWHDVKEPEDERGYPQPRFVIEDDKKGPAAYRVDLLWVLKPYSKEAFVADLDKFGGKATMAKVYVRGAFFQMDPALETLILEKVKDPALAKRLIGEVQGNFRSSNALRSPLDKK